MAWTVPRTWVVGEIVTASLGNTHWRDNLRYLKGLDGRTEFESAVAFLGDISPAALTGDVNDWNPTGLADAVYVRVDGGAAARSITGLSGGSDGRLIFLVNIGTVDITLVDESALSLAANRFALTANLRLRPDECVLLERDITSSRWRAINNSIDAAAIQSGTVATARLGTGTASSSTFLRGDQSWASSPSGLTRAGGNTTEATTTSTVGVDLLTVSGLSIATTTPFTFVGVARKTSGAVTTAGAGLKVNATVIQEAPAIAGPAKLWAASTANNAQDGGFWGIWGPRVGTTYRAPFSNLTNISVQSASGANIEVSASVQPTEGFDNAMPDATITSLIIRGRVGDAAVTFGADETHVYTYAVS